MRARAHSDRLPAWFARSRLLSKVRAEHVWFLVVGVWNSAFSYAVFLTLHLLFPRLHYLLVLLGTHVFSTLNAFVSYRRVVFRVQGHVVRDFGRFWLVNSPPWAINLFALPVLVRVVGLPVLVAQGSFMLIAAVFSYVGHKYFSFRRPAPPAPPEEER